MESYKETFKCYDTSDEFRQKSKNFVDWFWHSPATRLNLKVVLADQRHEGLGRGVSTCFDHVQYLHGLTDPQSPC